MSHLKIGTLLHGGQYSIEKVLGNGSFGITYLGRHISLGKKVCIKEFFMHDISTRQESGAITGMTDGTLQAAYGKKFKKEAQSLASIEHPNIVRVTDYFEENNTYYYVMDYIEGPNLNEYIKLRNVSLEETVSIIKEVGKALQYMHESCHMLHLDIKPGNVMRRTADGRVFLIDFGLSKHYDESGEVEDSTSIGLGTEGYAPVEQRNAGKGKTFQATLDVYALGATLYKMLTGNTPPSCSEIIADEDLLNNNLVEAGVPADLCSVVKHAMCQSAQKRTQTVREFISELDAADLTIVVVDDNEKTDFEPKKPEKPEKPEKPVPDTKPVPLVSVPQTKSNKNVIIWVVVALLVLAAGGVGGYLITQNKHTATSIGNDRDDDDDDDEDEDEEELLNGYSEETYDNCTYKGNFVDGLWDGEGTLEFTTGESYEGDFSNGQVTGYGTFTNPNNLYTDDIYQYQGYFVNGNYEGHGTAFYGNGTWTEGEWKNDELVAYSDSGEWDVSDVE